MSVGLAEAHPYLADRASMLGPFGRVVEIGGAGGSRGLFLADEYLRIDEPDGAEVTGHVDAVVCSDILERTSGAKVVASARRWLRPGGIFVAATVVPDWLLVVWVYSAAFDRWEIRRAGDEAWCTAVA